MSDGGDIHVLRHEAGGQESPRMPAWKREILERRKAKGGGAAGSPAPETSPGGAAGAPHVNGDVTGSVNGARRDGGGGVSARNYTITTASQHFANNKEPRAAERTPPREESLVLQESLGPLEENPFIKLEKERRRRQDHRESSARPVQHILELYGSVPGIRTIRAENIIIIESDPEYFPEAGEGKSRQQNGVDAYSSLNELLDRRGSAVTEIRAKEVVIYDTALSRSEENLSTLGRPDPDGPRDAGGEESQGRVSRILQKFDSNYGKLQKKSHSTENLLELDCSASARPRRWSKPQPDLVPKPRQSPSPAASSQPTSPVFQTPWTSKPKPQPEHQHPGSPQPVSSFRQRFEGPQVSGVVPRDEPDRGQSKPARERDWEAAEVPPKPKVPCSPETRRARAETSSLPISSKVLRSSSEFEIRPSPKPDVDRIPDGDTQARALANLRLQSKNSFTVVPKRHLQASAAPSSPGPPSPVKSSPSPAVPTPQSATPPTPDPTTPTLAPTTPTLAPMTPNLTVTSPTTPTKKEEEKEPEAPTVPPSAFEPTAPSSPPVLNSPSSPAPKQPTVDKLPVTNIDDVEVEPPHRVPVPSPMVQRKKGNTFTVVPKRSADPQRSSAEEPPEAPASEAPPESTPSPQPQYAQLGSLLKKRYPAVEDIQVIGGYLSLAKSCLSKTGSVGKKLKISFNESSLQSTYEYPSEDSVWDSRDEDEEERADGKPAEEPPSMVGRFHIPRPSLVGSPAHAENGNDLSSYIPKHSVDFSAWQENKQEDKVYQEAPSSPPITEEVMLTPADSSSLSDYSSEPALYF